MLHTQKKNVYVNYRNKKASAVTENNSIVAWRWR